MTTPCVSAPFDRFCSSPPQTFEDERRHYHRDIPDLADGEIADELAVLAKVRAARSFSRRLRRRSRSRLVRVFPSPQDDLGWLGERLGRLRAELARRAALVPRPDGRRRVA